ncbi:MAG: hypothetical protein ABI468_11110, partial [Candidatus Nanopelagicales bacterium]
MSDTGAVVPCSRPDWGWWSGRDDCYYRVLSPQPPPTEAAWSDKYPEGAIYEGHCAWPGNPSDVYD